MKVWCFFCHGVKISVCQCSNTAYNIIWVLKWEKSQIRVSHLFFFCFFRQFSPLFSTLLQSHSTKDSWLLGKIHALNGDDLSREHLAALCPWHFLCVKTIEMFKRENMQNLTMKDFNQFVHVTFYLGSIHHTQFLSVSAIPLSTPCSLSSPWCWTKMLSQRLPCYTQSCIRIFWRYLVNVRKLTIAVQARSFESVNMNALSSFHRVDHYLSRRSYYGF